jgi:hypothetical protein
MGGSKSRIDGPGVPTSAPYLLVLQVSRIVAQHTFLKMIEYRLHQRPDPGKAVTRSRTIARLKECDAMVAVMSAMIESCIPLSTIQTLNSGERLPAD